MKAINARLVPSCYGILQRFRRERATTPRNTAVLARPIIISLEIAGESPVETELALASEDEVDEIVRECGPISTVRTLDKLYQLSISAIRLAICVTLLGIVFWF
jgi:ribulose-5-phosphate 4-epimerase/fuculose-1-phosphate aldolase